MPPKIDRDMQIGELVMNYPQSVEVLFQYGFHCIGCGLSAYETLGQGAAAHGFDDETIDRIVEEIKKSVGAARSAEKIPTVASKEAEEKEKTKAAKKK